MQDHILVVGGAGYIGSHTAKLLKKRGYTPVVLDDLSTGHREAVRYGPYYSGSFRDIAFVEKVLQETGCKTVFHFGAKALVAESVVDPLLYYSANAGGTLDLLTAMKRVGVKNLIFSSTCATFGVPTESPIHEKVPQSPVNPYGLSKLLVENILRGLPEFNSVILRYFNAAGCDPDGELGEDHTPETHLIPRAIGVALGKEEVLEIYGNDYPTPDGTCMRDYVHVNDLAEAHILAMEKLWKGQPSFDVNLGSEQGYSVLEVLDTIDRVTGKPLRRKMCDRRVGDPPVLVADSSKAKKLLDWAPKHDLQSIVTSAYHWMRNHPRGYAGGGARDRAPGDK